MSKVCSYCGTELLPGMYIKVDKVIRENGDAMYIPNKNGKEVVHKNLLTCMAAQHSKKVWQG